MAQEHSEARCAPLYFFYSFLSSFFLSLPPSILPSSFIPSFLPFSSSLILSYILSIFFSTVLKSENEGSSWKSVLHSALLVGNKYTKLTAMPPAWHRDDWPEAWPPDLSGQGSHAVLPLFPPLLWLSSRQRAQWLLALCTLTRHNYCNRPERHFSKATIQFLGDIGWPNLTENSLPLKTSSRSCKTLNDFLRHWKEYSCCQAQKKGNFPRLMKGS